MANKTLKTRIQLKYDTYANWTENNPTPLSGEVCVVVVPAATNAVAQEPTVLFKVGDGTTPFNSLPFTGGIAADVYDWAKAATKPSYAANEITGLADFINNEVQDTDTQYTITQDENDGHKLILKSKGLNDTDWTEVVTITTVDTVYDDTALKNLVGNTSVATQIANAINDLDLPNTYEPKGEAARAVQAIQDGDSIDSFGDVEAALEGYAPKATSLSGYNIGDAYTKDEIDAKISSVYKPAGSVEFKDLPEAGKTVLGNVYNVTDEFTTTAAFVEGVGNKYPVGTNVVVVATGENTYAYDVLAGFVDLSDYAKDGDKADKVGGATSGNFAGLDGNGNLTDSGKKASDFAEAGHRHDNAEASTNGVGGKDGYMSAADKEKLNGIATGADVSNVQTVKVNGEALTPDDDKAVDITVPTGKLADKDEVAKSDLATALKTEIEGKANTNDLASIATSGNVNDLVQDENDYIIFNCGSATVNI